MVLLGLIAIAHAIVVSVRRGRHDLGVLRALGFRGRDVGATVAWQAVALAVVGGAIGIPLGVLVGRFVWRAVAEGTGVRTVYELPAVAVLVGDPGCGADRSAGRARFPRGARRGCTRVNCCGPSDGAAPGKHVRSE